MAQSEYKSGFKSKFDLYVWGIFGDVDADDHETIGNQLTDVDRAGRRKGVVVGVKPVYMTAYKVPARFVKTKKIGGDDGKGEAAKKGGMRGLLRKLKEKF